MQLCKLKILKFLKNFIVVNYPKGKTFQVCESRCGVMQGGIGLKVNPVLGVKFYLAKILACSGKNGILFLALRGHVKFLGVFLPQLLLLLLFCSNSKKFLRIRVVFF